MHHNPYSNLLPMLLGFAARENADHADALLVESLSVSASCRGGVPEGIERAESAGVSLRAWVGAQQAMASSTDMSEAGLKELAARVTAMARAAMPDEDSTLPPASSTAKSIPALDIYDATEPSAGALMQRAREEEEAALSVGGVTQCEGAEYSYSTSRVRYAASNGFNGEYAASMHGVSASALAGSGTEMERDYDYASRRFAVDLPPSGDIGMEAGKRAVKRLNPRKVKSCTVPVMFDPRVARGLVASFASAINGASIARGTSFLKDSLDQRLFPEAIHITDDPLLPRGLGSKPFDGEGLPTAKLALVGGGVLNSWLLDTRTAKRLGMQSTHHASRGLSSPPSPSPTNLYLHAGKDSQRALLTSMQNGFYVTETFGMGVNLVTGDYSQGAAGFWVENGELAYPVAGVTIASHLRDMFASLVAADDLEFRYGVNAPSLLIERMTVAGA